MRGLIRTVMVTLFAIVVSTVVISSQPALAAEKQVWAYYFGWYTGDSWGDGRLIDHPAAPYDSRDGGAIGRQIDEARGAGIDAFIMSWYGPKGDNLTHQVFNMLLDQAAARGFHAAVSLDLADPGYNSNVDEVIQSLSYVINDRANHGGYLRYEGKPVIYFWNQGRYSLGDWQNIRAQVDPNHNTIWVAEGTNTGFLPTFDGLYLFNTAWAGNPASTARQWLNATLNAGGTFYTPTVLPGWDESRIDGRGNPTSPRDRNGGQFLTNSWNGAAQANTGAILIVSWNEYLENSHIEPSQNFGTQSLDTLRPLIATWKGGSTGAAPEVVTQSGDRVLTPTVVLNVRAEPNSASTSLGKINPGDVYAVRGESNGWFQIDFNGGQGWVSGQFVTVNQETAPAAPAGGAAGAPTGVTFTASNNVRLRTAPNTEAEVLATVPFEGVLEAVGRTSDNAWVQVNFNGASGWVSSQFGTLTADINGLPVTA
jgi:uncharacterized protein YgiM (DUF1202 family)